LSLFLSVHLPPACASCLCPGVPPSVDFLLRYLLTFRRRILGCATVFTPFPPSQVLADAAAAAVYTNAPLSSMLADAATAAVFTLAPLPMVRAEPAAVTFFACAPLSHVPADLAATTVFTPFSPSLVLADTTAAAIRAHVLDATVLAPGHTAPTAQPQPTPGHAQTEADGRQVATDGSRAHHCQQKGKAPNQFWSSKYVPPRMFLLLAPVHLPHPVLPPPGSSASPVQPVVRKHTDHTVSVGAFGPEWGTHWKETHGKCRGKV